MALYQGTFADINNNAITVKILTNGDSSTVISMGDAEAGDDILFNYSSPVTIDAEMNDTFDHLLPHSCSINLLCRSWIEDFFTQDHRQGIVNIMRGSEYLFCGYIEPQAYSQNYNDVYDEVELSCVDVLSALQYSNYAQIGTTGVSYSDIKQNADQKTFKALIDGLLPTDFIIGATTTPTLIYDGSKAIDSTTAHKFTVFEDISINELLFLGDEQDDVWTDEDILTELMQYLNLHITQIGDKFYIFSWETVRAGKSAYWYDLTAKANKLVQSSTITLTGDMLADNNTSIEVNETYNKIQVSCDVKSIESVIESPLDDDAITSPYTNRQKYMSEYIALGEGTTAYASFKSFVINGYDETTWSDASSYDYYIQIFSPANWTLIDYASGEDVMTKYCGETYQDNILKKMTTVNYLPCIVKVGKTDEVSLKDSSVQNSLDESTYLAISVNGNGDDSETAADAIQTELQKVANAGGIINYTCPVAGGLFSPVDDETTNYLVFSGKMILVPWYKESTGSNDGLVTSNYADLLKHINDTTVFSSRYFWHRTPKSTKNGNRYYFQRFYKAETPASSIAIDTNNRGLIPLYDDYEANKELQYNYSSDHSQRDNIDKVEVLECELKIGTKYCVEEFYEYTDPITKVTTRKSKFTWYDEANLPTVTDDDGNTYSKSTFSLGINPAIDDCIIGQEYDLQNTIDFTMNIDAKGTAIPIKKSDALSGKLSFKILGPINNTWDTITRRHPTMFRHTKWTTTSQSILAHCSSIIIEDFECKVYSDNGLINNTSDNDLVYVSNTDETYRNVKDGIDFKINSALTSAECVRYHVTNSVKMSNPTLVSDGGGLVTIYDRNKTAEVKAETDYVDSYYNEYHEGHLELTVNLQEAEAAISPWNLYTHPTLGKTFHVEGVNRDIIKNTATLKLKEIK